METSSNRMGRHFYIKSSSTFVLLEDFPAFETINLNLQLVEEVV